MSMRLDSLRLAVHFAMARWLPGPRSHAELQALQRRKLEYFLSHVLHKAPYYRAYAGKPFALLPIADKATMMEHFGGFNTRGISAQKALAVALQAEASRDFSAQIGDLTVGLSSGTSGNRGLFLVSPAERMQWAGVLLARALPQALLPRLINPRQPKLRIAFMLRANSQLYTTLKSRRIDFAFYDLVQGVQCATRNLNAQQPDILVAPPAALRLLAGFQKDGELHIRPSHVISVADVLEESDNEAVFAAFGTKCHQLYQATEGFLGYTCAKGHLHLNERQLMVEPDWLDEAHTRFQPIITDFSRTTQLIVRYRLNDVLSVHDAPCPCGNPERVIEAVAGRSDDILWLHDRSSGRAMPLFPDLLRRAMWFVGPELNNYRIKQQGTSWEVALETQGNAQQLIATVTSELTKLWSSRDLVAPDLHFTKWQAAAAGAKRKRIIQDPTALSS